MENERRTPPEICPVCGHDVPRNASACRQCGADYNSGWHENAEVYDSLDLPGQDFDYNEFVQKEFKPSRFKPSGMKTIWWVTGIVVIIVAVVSYIISLR